jgi:hypothetical protein
MVLKEFVLFSVLLNILQIIVQENVYLDVLIILIILRIGKVEHVLVYVLKLIQQNSMQITIQELVFQIAQPYLMELIGILLFAFVCLCVVDFNILIFQLVIVYQYVLGILIYMASLKISHVFKNAILHMRRTHKMSREHA